MPSGLPDGAIAPRTGVPPETAAVRAIIALLLVLVLLAAALAVLGISLGLANAWPLIVLAEASPWLFGFLLRRWVPGVPPVHGPSPHPFRRALLLGGACIAGAGAAAGILGTALALQGMAGTPWLVAGGAGLLLGAAVIGLCARLWGTGFLLAETLRDHEDAASPPLGGEALHVRVLLCVAGVASAASGAWMGIREHSFTGRAAAFLLIGALLLGVAVAAFLKARPRRGA